MSFGFLIPFFSFHSLSPSSSLARCVSFYAMFSADIVGHFFMFWMCASAVFVHMSVYAVPSMYAFFIIGSFSVSTLLQMFAQNVLWISFIAFRRFISIRLIFYNWIKTHNPWPSTQLLCLALSPTLPVFIAASFYVLFGFHSLHFYFI